MAKKDDETAPPRVYRGPVRRLRVVVEDGAWQVAKETHVERMTIPSSWEPDDRASRTASCVEVLDANGEVIHRQQVRDPLDSSIEVAVGGSFERADTARPVVLDVAVPDRDDIAAIRVVAHGVEVPRRRRKDGGGYDQRQDRAED